LCALYKDPCFQRVNEIHFRLGLIYKHLEDYEQSLKHLKLALYDSSSSLSSINKAEIKYSIANLFELNDNCFEALERYEDLLFANTRQQQQVNNHSNDTEEKLDNKLKAKLYRQLGWLHYYSEKISKQSDKSSLAPIKAEIKSYHLQQADSANQPSINQKSLQQAVDYLSKSAQLDPSQNLTWFYLGRVFASKGCSRESFICYKNSVNNPEATADTWASIGILYYHQKQHMDSLQAFICAIQLDRRHYAAWLNLGHLYEEDNQIEEALKCYIMAIKSNMHHSRMKRLKTTFNENEFQEFNLNFNELSQLDSLLKEFEEIQHNEEETVYKDEYKLLVNRAKSLITYFDSSADKIRDHLNRLPHNLPNLKEAFKLQIPIELKKKIISMDINASNLSLASNVNKKDLKSQQQQQVNKNIPLNQSTHPNAIVTVQEANKQNNSLNNRANMKKIDQLVILKPNQIQLMNQLELNRNQLNAEQMQMLNYLKSQYFIMQSQQAQLQQQPQTNPSAPASSTIPSSSPLSASVNQLKANAQTQAKQEQANTFNDLNFALDQLPHDLENIQPITIMQEDITILHDSDINALLSRQDLAEIGETMDKSSLDQIFEKNPNSQQNSKTMSLEKNKLTFSSEIIKLDPTLLEGSMTTNKLSESNSGENIPLTDEEILNSKLSIDMTSDQILNACKSYGLNGIQNNSFLKPDRFGSNKVVLNFLNEKELIEDKTVNSKKKKQRIENGDEESQNENDTNIDGGCIDNDEDDDDDENGLDETLPYGSIAFNKTLINDNLSRNKLNLQPPGPSVVLETKKDALSSHLQYFCLSHPISVVRGLSQVLRLDLGLFSTRSLVDTDPNHIVEVRTQRQQATDENIDWNTKTNTWKCESTQSYTTVLKYAQYQANSFQEAVKEEKLNAVSPNKRSSAKLIKFGTNVDLSDEKKWKIQLQELAKLPQFMRVVSSGNMLTHVGYKIYGVNTLQMYLKVPGCRTPGHQENNSFCSLNINIGPGDCEWFGVDEKYWMLIEQLCEKNSVDYLNGAWWPNLKELHDANIPVYRFLQKPGDLVWVNSGCVHWVQSIGWCNNVSWNIGPLVYLQYKSAIERYEWNKLKFYKSIVPMVHLSWNLARNLKITDRRLFEYIRYVLMHSLKQCQLAINYVENCGGELKYQSRQLDEPAHYCFDCDCEVFNILFVSEQPIANTSDSITNNSNKSKQDKQITMQHVVHCQQCARKRNHLLDNFVILHQFQMDELKQVYDQFQLYVPSLQTIMSSINNQNSNCTMHVNNTSSNLSITHTTSLNNSSNESNSNQNVKFY
jgi:tetratricopeptide (TPR) repeat protein